MIQQIQPTLANARDYRVIPLREGHLDDAVMLGALLHDEPLVEPDPRRGGFYWIAGDHGRYYVNVHDATRTIYLVTVARPHAN